MDGHGAGGSSEVADAGTRDVRRPFRGIDIPEGVAGEIERPMSLAAPLRVPALAARQMQSHHLDQEFCP